MSCLRIIGGGGHGRVVADIAHALGYTDIAFFDVVYPEETQRGAWPVVGPVDEPTAHPRICAIGSNTRRAEVFFGLGLADGPSLIHPSCVLSPSATIGAGTVMMPGAIINAGAQIGCSVIVNTAASIDHDADVSDFVHISPGVRLAGGVRVGQRSWIGIGAVIREGVKIGNDVMIGAGAAVVSDIESGSVVGGVPADPVVRN